MPVVTLGEALGLVVLEPGALEHVHRAEVRIGGAEANVAIGLSRLGVPAHWIGRVGADGLGRRIARELRAEGVATTLIVDPDAGTGLMLKERPGPGRTVVQYYRSASAGSRLAPGDLPPGLVEGASLLHVTGITPALGAAPGAAVRTAIERARSAGVPVSFDVNHRSTLWRDAADAGRWYREIAERSDIVFAGLDEAAILLDRTPRDAEDAAAAIAGFGTAEAILKLGDKGALAMAEGRTVRQPAVPVEVADTVGAGDAFVAGYLAERLLGADLEHRMRTAAAAGAFACTSVGDWEALPSRAQLGAWSTDPVQR